MTTNKNNNIVDSDHLNAGLCLADIYRYAQQYDADRFRQNCIQRLTEFMQVGSICWLTFDINSFDKKYSTSFIDLDFKVSNRFKIELQKLLIDLFHEYVSNNGIPSQIEKVKVKQPEDSELGSFVDQYSLGYQMHYLWLDPAAYKVHFLTLFRQQLFNQRDLLLWELILSQLNNASQLSSNQKKLSLWKFKTFKANCDAMGGIKSADNEFRELLERYWGFKSYVPVWFIQEVIIESQSVDGVTLRAKQVDRNYYIKITINMDLLADLTKTEVRIAHLMSKGLQAKFIASILGSSSRTVEKHQANIYKKLKTENRSETISLLADLQK